MFLSAEIMALSLRAFAAGETIIQAGDTAGEMYLICRGSVEVTDKAGKQLRRMNEGEYFGEIALLMPTPRTATVKAVAQCDLFVPERSAFVRIMQDNPHFAESVVTLARERYHLTISGADLMHA